ncbi:hypothetical protein TNCV_4645221 [Trichonephila clavipes]|nr:hypothetical protein TNCV_4645221 [Trichonephila clavipes]
MKSCQGLKFPGDVSSRQDGNLSNTWRELDTLQREELRRRLLFAEICEGKLKGCENWGGEKARDRLTIAHACVGGDSDGYVRHVIEKDKGEKGSGLGFHL